MFEGTTGSNKSYLLALDPTQTPTTSIRIMVNWTGPNGAAMSVSTRLAQLA